MKKISILLSISMFIYGLFYSDITVLANQVTPNSFVYELPIAAACGTNYKTLQYYYGTFKTSNRIVKICQYFNGSYDTNYNWHYVFLDANGNLYTPYTNKTFTNGYFSGVSTEEKCVTKNISLTDTECFKATETK